MNCFCLSSEQIDNLWSEFDTHAQRLAKLEYVDPDELRDDLKAAKKQLWGVQENGRVLGIAITRVTGGVKTCEIVAAAGTQTAAGQIQTLYEDIEQWAQAIGCVRMRILGRKGWLRALAGYKQVGVIIEKEL